MSEVVTFGEAMAAMHGTGPLRLGGSLQLSVAGAESNVAIGLARLGHDVEWVGRVGRDELGELVLRTLRAEGVRLGGPLRDHDAPTGVLLFEHRIADITRVSYYRAGSAGSGIRADDVVNRIAAGTRIVHVTGVTAALGPAAADAVAAAVRRAREVNADVSLDINFRSRLWTADDAGAVLQPLLPDVDLLFGSEDELAVVAPGTGSDVDAAVSRILDQGVSTVVVKRGSAGATVCTATDKNSAPARSVPVVDVVGAGDAFVAGYLSGRLDGLETAGCLDRAVVLGAFAVSRIGDWEALPTRDELSLLDAPEGTTLR